MKYSISRNLSLYFDNQTNYLIINKFQINKLPCLLLLPGHHAVTVFSIKGGLEICLENTSRKYESYWVKGAKQAKI